MAALVVVTPSAQVAAAVPRVVAAAPDGALTAERLYRLTLSRTYGRPAEVDVPGQQVSGSLLTDSGIVVGTTYPDGVLEPRRAFRWRDGPAELMVPRPQDAQVVDADDAGRVLGYLGDPSLGEAITPFLWETDGTVVAVPADAGSTWTSVDGLTDDGTVVGVLDGARLVTWRDGVLTDLEVPGDTVRLPPWWERSVTDDGRTVAGYVRSGDGPTRAYVWRDGVPSELPAPAGAWSSVGFMSDDGDVVGTIDRRAVLWSDGRVRDLDPQGRYGLEPTAVNRHGTVVGSTRVHHVRGGLRSDARGVTRLPGLGGAGGAQDVHDLEVAVGSASRPGDGTGVPIMWVYTVPVRLGTQLGDLHVVGGHAWQVNARGQVIGYLWSDDGTLGGVRGHLVLWDLRTGR